MYKHCAVSSLEGRSNIEGLDHGNTTPEGFKQHYTLKAQEYDAQYQKNGWREIVEKAVEIFLDALRGIPRKGSFYVLDAGAGTGLVGEQLDRARESTLSDSPRPQRRLHVYAQDITRAMLVQALQKEVYEGAEVSDVCDEKAALRHQKAFDGIISVGLFGGTVDPKEGIPKLLLQCKPGGVVVVASRESYFEEEFKPFIRDHLNNESYRVEYTPPMALDEVGQQSKSGRSVFVTISKLLKA